MFYAPLPDELDLWPLATRAAKAGKKIALPRYEVTAGKYEICDVHDLSRDLVRGRWGIREPSANCRLWPTNWLDLILVPGVAFDLHGRRVGRGKGYYDQILTNMRGMRCGVAFDEQLVLAVPSEAHDATLNCILTPTRWVEL